MREDFNLGGPAFSAIVERPRVVPVVRLYGEVDLGTIPWAEETFAEAAALMDGTPAMVLDLIEVTFMDSTGIGALVGRRSELGEGRLWLVLGTGGARRTIELAGVEGAFRVCNDLEVAVGEAREAAGK